MKDHQDKGDLGDLARDVTRELRATSELLREAAALGKKELLFYLNKSLDSRTAGSWGGAVEQASRAQESSGGSYRYSYVKPDTAERLARERAARENAAQKRGTSVPGKKGRAFRRAGYGRWAFFWISMPFLLTAFITGMSFLTSIFYGHAEIGLLSVCLSFLAVGGGLFGIYAGRSRRDKRYDRYLTIIGQAGNIRVTDLADKAGVRCSKLLEDLDDMVGRGYFGEQAYVDRARGLLIIDPAAAVESEPQPAARKTPEAAQAAPAAEKSDRYEAMLQELRALNERIEDEAMSERIYRIEAVARATFMAVKEKPEKEQQIRRFMDYYLPTAIRLLDAYAGFEEQGFTGSNIQKSKENIEKMTETLSVAFEKQFDSLFLTETMDINAEIRAMDSMLRQDGFVGGMPMPGGGK